MRRIVLVAVIAVAALSACSTGSSDAASTAPIETYGAAEDDASSTPTPAPSEDATIALPIGFPSDVPLPDGTLVTASDLGGQGFQLGYTNVTQEALDEYLVALEAAGFTSIGAGDLGEDAGYFYDRDDWALSFGTADANGVYSLALTIVTRS